MNWPPINFLDPGPPPRGRKKAPGFFDEYLPDSEEEEEVKGVRRSIAEGFYGRTSRSTRSSAALIPGHSSSRNPRRLCANNNSSAAVDIDALEEEGLPAREKAKKARHKARDLAKVMIISFFSNHLIYKFQFLDPVP